MLALLKSLVRSTAEYASVLWAPADQTNINKLEQIQRRFTSKFAMFRSYDEVTGLGECTTDYWERLEKLKLDSLERRRERYIIMYMYKIHIGAVPNIGFEKEFNERTKTKFYAKHNRKAPRTVQTLRRASLFSRGPQLYNLLPEELRGKADVEQGDKKKAVENFKRDLDKWLELIPDEPNVPGLTERRVAEKNSINSQYEHHWREIKPKWKVISEKMKKDKQRRVTQAAARSGDEGGQVRDNNHRRPSITYTTTHHQHDARVNRVW